MSITKNKKTLEEELKEHALYIVGAFLSFSNGRGGLFWKTRMMTKIVMQFESSVEKNIGIPGILGSGLGKKKAVSLFKDEVATILTNKDLQKKARLSYDKIEKESFRELNEQMNANKKSCNYQVVDYESGKSFLDNLFNKKYIPIAEDFVDSLNKSGYPAEGKAGIMGITLIDVIMIYVAKLMWETDKLGKTPSTSTASLMTSLGKEMAMRNIALLGAEKYDKQEKYANEAYEDATRIFNYLKKFNYGGKKDIYDLLNVEIQTRLLHYVGELKKGDTPMDYLIIMGKTKKYDVELVGDAIKSAAKRLEAIFSDPSIIRAYSEYIKFLTAESINSITL